MYYDRIANQWDSITGSKGGALKKYVLNDAILSKISRVDSQAILEIGAGNGYFIPLLLRSFSSQIPKRIVISDISKKLLAIAQKKFLVPGAEYIQLDVRKHFPFSDGDFNLILATMIFNELTRGALFRALKECSRVLNKEGTLVATVLHPEFIKSLEKRGKLKQNKKGYYTMPGGSNLRLPVVRRTMSEYYYLFEQTGFQFTVDDIYPSKKVLNEKKGLKYAGNCPLAAIFTCKLKD